MKTLFCSRTARLVYILAAALNSTQVDAETHPTGYDTTAKKFVILIPEADFIEVSGILYCHTFVFDHWPNRSCDQEQVVPPQPNFMTFVHDLFAGYNSSEVLCRGTNGLGQGTNILAMTNYYGFGPAGGSATNEAESSCDSYAKAHAEIAVDGYAGTNVVTGYAWAWGTNTLVGQAVHHKTYAFSVAMVKAAITNRTQGKITLTTSCGGSRVGSSGAEPGKVITKPQDPVTYHLKDRETGIESSGLFFRYIMETLPGATGEAWWASNNVHVAVSDCSFRLEMPSPYTASTGHIQMEVRGGTVLLAESSGAYAGVLPPVGTTVPFDFLLSNNQEMLYDLTSVMGTNVELTLDLSSIAEGEAESEGAAPALTVAANPGLLTLSWPLTPRPFQLLTAVDLRPGALWTNVLAPHSVDQGRETVSVPMDTDARFFRLRSLEVGPCSLAITSQPLDAFAGLGSDVTWMVSAVGAPPPTSFQWQRLGKEGSFIDVPGAVGPFLSWEVSSEDRGAQFRCMIQNDCSTVTSMPAKLIIPD